MCRYIDVDKLISHIKDEIKGCATPVGDRANGKTLAYGTALGLKMALSFAETLPTADVVEVVRCKDCKYWTGKDYDGCCIKNGLATRFTNDYCSHGERSENEASKI